MNIGKKWLRERLFDVDDFAAGKKIGRRAFTFVELMIALAITGTIVSVVYNFFFFGKQASEKGTTRALMTKKIRNTMAWISRDLRTAKEIKEIKPDKLEIDTYVSELVEDEHVNVSGDSLKMNVKYEVRQSGEREALYRTVNDEGETKMMEYSKIELPVFMSKTYNRAGELVTFDFRQNDSFERARISLVTIELSVRDREEKVGMKTSVFIRSNHGLIDRPFWQNVK
jgi:prepilin-type N-terminal cleavage/methylation domain-containing protein